jgi:hypothetical protein
LASWLFEYGSGTSTELLMKMSLAIHDSRTLALPLLAFKKDGSPYWAMSVVSPSSTFSLLVCILLG